MKLILTTLVAAGLSTAAIAGTSDRYDDQRFNSAVGHVSQATTDTAQPTVVFSSRNNGGPSTSYPYINPYGVGPNNDSR